MKPAQHNQKIYFIFSRTELQDLLMLLIFVFPSGVYLMERSWSRLLGTIFSYIAESVSGSGEFMYCWYLQ